MSEGSRTFHITVGAAPSAPHGSGISLEHELELVKAALLYGDRAALCSPTCMIALSLTMLGSAAAQAAPAEQIRLIRQVYASMIDAELAEALDMFERLRKKKHRGSRENMALLRLEKLIAQSWNEARDGIYEKVEGSGLAELLAAREAGLLDLYSVNDMRMGAKEEVLDSILNDFLARINAAVSGTTSYALLDAEAGNLIWTQIAGGQLSLSDAHLSRGRHVALAGDLLRRLPHFGAATLNEIIDIRRELEQPLKRFRVAMIDHSDRIAAAPWEQAFSAESDRVFVREIEPAVLELEEAVRSRPYLQALVGRYFKSPKDYLLPAAAQAAAQLAAPVLSLFAADSEAFVRIAAAALGAAHYAALLADVRTEVRKTHRPDQHQLFFYYRAGQLLKVQ